MTVLQKNWKELINPSNVNVDYLNDCKTFARITVEPLERGFGNTLGNSLRRVLLSSIRGFAITSIRIDGVLHEFDLISGVKEDVADIIMNIKSLIIDKTTPSSATIRLRSNKKGVLYARDIELENDVRILNPDLIICHVEEDDVNLNIEMSVEFGIGYHLSSDKKQADKDFTCINLDALFNPVKRVAYSVENARIGQRTDYDRLILEVETNGAISPEDAVGLSAKIIQEQLNPFISFDVQEDTSVSNENSGEGLGFNENLLKRVDEMELSVRAYNCLVSENILYIADLVKKSENEMLKLTNFGRKSLNELKENLKTMGLSFGMNLDGIDSELLAKELSKKKSASGNVSLEPTLADSKKKI